MEPSLPYELGVRSEVGDVVANRERRELPPGPQVLFEAAEERVPPSVTRRGTGRRRGRVAAACGATGGAPVWESPARTRATSARCHDAGSGMPAVRERRLRLRAD